MDLGLKDKVALVAAASKGLGLAVATELAREGANVVFSAATLPGFSGGGTNPAGDRGRKYYPWWPTWDGRKKSRT